MAEDKMYAKDLALTLTELKFPVGLIRGELHHAEMDVKVIASGEDRDALTARLVKLLEKATGLEYASRQLPKGPAADDS